MHLNPLDYMSFKNDIMQDWVREAKYNYDIDKLEMLQQVQPLIQFHSVDHFFVKQLIDLCMANSYGHFSRVDTLRCGLTYHQDPFNCEKK